MMGRAADRCTLSRTQDGRMSLNKKTKKQLDVEHKKLAQLQLQLAGARKQLDDPAEVTRLEREIAATNGRIEKLKQLP